MESTTEPSVAVRGVRYAYGDTLAVDDVSFDVARGEILGFLGPNGAGKSTTIKMVTGQLEQQAGTIRVLGRDMPRDKAEVQRRIGVSFEEKNLYPDMSARENLRFFARLYGIDGFDPDPFLETVDLVDRADDRVSSYSKGMQQRLMVARSLVNEPEVLFLDEPTAGLDPVSSQAIHGIVRRQAEQGTAVLLTTHDMAEADKLSDRVAFIDDGCILTIDTPESLKLAHGRRSVRIRARRNGDATEIVIPLDEPGADDRIRQEVAQEGLLTIHTEEASLEDIFIEFAGRGLEG